MKELKSEGIVVSAPMSYHGSAARSWKLVRRFDDWKRYLIGTLVVLLLIPLWWLLVSAWYLTFGLLLSPYRLIRRGSRKRKLEALRHRELLARD